MWGDGFIYSRDMRDIEVTTTTSLQHPLAHVKYY